jgi:hippurate hydrolase
MRPSVRCRGQSVGGEVGAVGGGERPAGGALGEVAAEVDRPRLHRFFGGTEPSSWEGADPAGEQPSTVHGNHSPFFAPVADPALRDGITHLLDAASEWLDQV